MHENGSKLWLDIAESVCGKVVGGLLREEADILIRCMDIVPGKA
jgi:hypothetical protein